MATYEVLAVRYGSRGGLTRGDYYLRFPTYGEPDAEILVARVFSGRAQNSERQHGDRLLVLYARGVAAVEVAPRGAVL